MRTAFCVRLVAAVSLALALCNAGFSQAGTCAGMTVGQLTSLNGFVPFLSSSLWNTDISTAAVDANSAIKWWRGPKAKVTVTR
jgi:hypothetical protein